MATILFGGGVADVRGSIGGVVFSRSKAGATARARVKGINPNSTGQQSARLRLNNLSLYWASTLTAPERSEWDDYAAATVMYNRLGQPMKISGLSMFVRTNTLALLAEAAIINTAPVTPGLGAAVPFTASIMEPAAEVTINTIESPWAKDVVGDTMLFFQSRVVGPGRASKPGGLKFLGSAIGKLLLPPTPPISFPTLYALATGNLCQIEGVHLDPEGRVSTRSVVKAIIED